MVFLKKSIVIGLTGPSGAGKSTICSSLDSKDFMIIDADKVAHYVINGNCTCRKKLVEFFGKDILNSNWDINRKILAKKAFSSKANTQKLNDITHPYIVAAIKRIIEKGSNLNFKAIILDAAVLFESGLDAVCDATVAVLSNIAARKLRIMARDKLNSDEADLRLAAQNNDFFYHKAQLVFHD